MSDNTLKLAKLINAFRFDENASSMPTQIQADQSNVTVSHNLPNNNEGRNGNVWFVGTLGWMFVKSDGQWVRVLTDETLVQYDFIVGVSSSFPVGVTFDQTNQYIDIADRNLHIDVGIITLNGTTLSEGENYTFSGGGNRIAFHDLDIEDSDKITVTGNLDSGITSDSDGEISGLTFDTDTRVLTILVDDTDFQVTIPGGGTGTGDSISNLTFTNSSRNLTLTTSDTEYTVNIPGGGTGTGTDYADTDIFEYALESSDYTTISGNTVYQFVRGNISWTSADSEAQTLFYNGVRGNLATINSQAQQDAINRLMNAVNRTSNTAMGTLWLGANDLDSEGLWMWGNYGEGANRLFHPSDRNINDYYTNWGPTEPNNVNDSEHYLAMFGFRHVGSNNTYPAGSWVDLPVAFSSDTSPFSNVGYIVEFPGAASSDRPNGLEQWDSEGIYQRGNVVWYDADNLIYRWDSDADSQMGVTPDGSLTVVPGSGQLAFLHFLLDTSNIDFDSELDSYAFWIADPDGVTNSVGATLSTYSINALRTSLNLALLRLRSAAGLNVIFTQIIGNSIRVFISYPYRDVPTGAGTTGLGVLRGSNTNLGNNTRFGFYMTTDSDDSLSRAFDSDVVITAGQSGEVQIPAINRWTELSRTDVDIDTDRFVQYTDIFNDGTGQTRFQINGGVASGDNSISMGQLSTANARVAIAIGDNAHATAERGMAIGNWEGRSTEATFANAVAIGNACLASNHGSFAGGRYSQATGQDALAIGQYSEANGFAAISLGADADTHSGRSIAIGNRPVVNEGAHEGIAIGAGTIVDSDNVASLAIGVQSHTRDKGSTAIGSFAQTSGRGAAVFGGGEVGLVRTTTFTVGTDSAHNYTIPISDSEDFFILDGAPEDAITISPAIHFLESETARITGNEIHIPWGNGSAPQRSASTSFTIRWIGVRSSRAYSDNSVAVGTRSRVDSESPRSTAIGYNAYARGIDNVAMGTEVVASGNSDTVCVGARSTSSGTRATSMGADNVASGLDSTSVGAENNASGDLSLALGVENETSGEASGAVGILNEVTNFGSITAGRNNFVGGFAAGAVGSDNYVAGDFGIAMGGRIYIPQSAQSNLAMGLYANVTQGSGSIVLGTGVGEPTSYRTDSDIVITDTDVMNSYFRVPFDTDVYDTFITLPNDISGRPAPFDSDAPIYVNDSEITNEEFDRLRYVYNRIQFPPAYLQAGDRITLNYFSVVSTESRASDAIAIGTKTKAKASNAIAMGREAIANGLNSLSIGAGSEVTGTNAQALGISNIVNGTNVATAGRGNVVYGNNSGSLGGVNQIGSRMDVTTSPLDTDTDRNTNFAVALGARNLVLADWGIAVGTLNKVRPNALRGMAFGYNSEVTDTDGIAIGNDSVNHGTLSLAVGHNIFIDTDAENAVAIGTNVGFNLTVHEDSDGYREGIGFGSTAIGKDTRAPGRESAAYGYTARALGHNATALGQGAQADTDNTLAVGEGSRAQAFGSTAIGVQSTATGEHGVALGDNTIASGLNSVSLGENTRAQQESSVAIGKNAVSSNAFAIAIGMTANTQFDHEISVQGSGNDRSQFLTIPVDSTDPTNGRAGSMYFNTTSNQLRVHNGSSWQNA